MSEQTNEADVIYCLEDDESIRGLMLYALNAAGFNAIGFADGQSLYGALGEQMPRLLLLDIMLPGEDGLTILRKLRSQPQTANLPIIMATAKGTEYDKVTGLDWGADDYLAKPFGMMEMVSRVRAVLRRCADPNSAIERISVDALQMNLEERTVLVAGQPIQLTYKEFELLRALASRPRVVFSRDQLLNDIWGVDFVGETRTVDVHIKTLRQKLGSCGTLIKTVRNIGYKLDPEQ